MAVLIIVGLGLAMYRFWYDGGHTIVTVGNTQFAVEIADDSQEREQGLQGKKKLGEDKGMLFIFPNRAQHQFWMKDTLVSLDIIWIDGNKVVDITKHVKPAQEGIPDYEIPTYSPDTPVTMVMEIGEGLAEKYKIDVGDTVRISDSGE